MLRLAVHGTETLKYFLNLGHFFLARIFLIAVFIAFLYEF